MDAAVKYMIKPVTSTSVATKGAEDTAGSKPRRFNNMGNNEPIILPQSTTPSRESPTTKPISKK